MKSQDHEGARLAQKSAARRTPSSGLTSELRAEAIAYARRRVAQGASQATVARELAVTTMTVSRWLSLPMTPARPVKRRPKMRRVQVVDMKRASGAIVVTTPRGFRIEGLDFDALCTLMTRCG